MRLMNPAQASVLCAIAASLANPAIAEEETGADLFRKALLGHCYSAITGKTLMKTDSDVSTWNEVVWTEGTDGGGVSRNARAKSTKSGAVIVDRTQDACYVQAGNVDSAALARDLRDQLQKPPFSAVVLDDQTTETPRSGLRKRSVVFGVVSEPGDTVPVIVINEFFPPAPGVVTGRVVLGVKDKRRP